MSASIERASPPLHQAQRDILILLIGFGLGSFAWNICWPFLPLQVQAIGVTNLGEIARLSGLLAGWTNLITASLGPVWSTLGERFGYRLQIMRAHLGTAIGMAAVGLATTPVALTGAASSLGLLGGNYPHYVALAASRTPRNEVGRVIGDLQAASQIGATAGPIVGGLVAGALGLPAAFMLAAVMSILALSIVFVAARPDQPRSTGQASSKGSLRKAFAQPETRRLIVLFLLADALIQGLRPLIPVMIASRLADPAAVATTTGLAVTLATAGMVASALIVGRLSQRVAPHLILLGTLPAAGVAAILVSVAPGLPALLVAWSLLGLASGATAPAIFAYMGRLSPDGGGAYALLAIVNMLGFAIGPVIIGQASVYGLEWPFRLAAVSTAAAVAFILVARPT